MSAAAGTGAAAGQGGHSVAKGLALYAAAMMILPVADGIAKMTGGSLPPGEVAWGRFLFHAMLTIPVLAAIAGWRGLWPSRIWPNVIRGVLIAFGTTCFFVGLTRLPLADSTAIFFIQPLVLTIISALFERETIGWRRWVAIAIGFLGAMIVIRPSFAIFGVYALLPACSAVSFAFYMLLNRRQRGTDSPLSMQFSAALAAFVTMTIFMAIGILVDSPIFVPSMPTPTEWGAFAVMGAMAALAHLMIIQGFAMAPGSVLAPCQFLQIISATLFGFVVFGDFPDAGKWVGILIVIACGAYVFWRETRRKPRS